MKPLVIFNKKVWYMSHKAALRARLRDEGRALVHVRALKTKTEISAWWGYAGWGDRYGLSNAELDRLIAARLNVHPALAVTPRTVRRAGGYAVVTFDHYTRRTPHPQTQSIVDAFCVQLAQPPTDAEVQPFLEARQRRLAQAMEAQRPTFTRHLTLLPGGRRLEL